MLISNFFGLIAQQFLNTSIILIKDLRVLFLRKFLSYLVTVVEINGDLCQESLILLIISVEVWMFVNFCIWKTGNTGLSSFGIMKTFGQTNVKLKTYSAKTLNLKHCPRNVFLLRTIEMILLKLSPVDKLVTFTSNWYNLKRKAAWSIKLKNLLLKRKSF